MVLLSQEISSKAFFAENIQIVDIFSNKRLVNNIISGKTHDVISVSVLHQP